MKEKKIEGVVSIDGFRRTFDQEKQLNQEFAGLFKDKLGDKVLEYLKAITINSVSGPEISNEKLRHLEGSRYIVGLIEYRIKQGRDNG